MNAITLCPEGDHAAQALYLAELLCLIASEPIYRDRRDSRVAEIIALMRSGGRSTFRLRYLLGLLAHGCGGTWCPVEATPSRASFSARPGVRVTVSLPRQRRRIDRAGGIHIGLEALCPAASEVIERAVCTIASRNPAGVGIRPCKSKDPA